MGNKVAAMAGLAESAGLNQGGQFRIWVANLEATTVVLYLRLEEIQMQEKG